MLRAPCSHGALSLFLRYTNNFQFVACDFELDFVFCEREAVNALGIVLVGGARILLQDFDERGAHFFAQLGESIGILDVNFVLLHGVCKTADSFGMRVRVGKVRLDIDDRCAVHEVGATDDDFRTFGSVEMDLLNLHARERDRVRAEA